VAAEMNLSETAFLRPLHDGYQLRWFTPVTEVDLCGHATLAAAHVLWEERGVEPTESIAFHTRSGLLSAGRVDGLIELDFPAAPPEPCDPDTTLCEALGIEAVPVAASKFDRLVVLESAGQVRALRPDFGALSRVATRGVIVTAPGDDGVHDFVSRFFAPSVGVDEDPVTGSAHCCLAPYWAGRLGREALMGRQVSARGGSVRVRLIGSRVLLGGAAVTVFRGELRDPPGVSAGVSP